MKNTIRVGKLAPAIIKDAPIVTPRKTSIGLKFSLLDLIAETEATTRSAMKVKIK